MSQIVEQAGTELGQAQLKLGLDFTVIFCTIKIWPAMDEKNMIASHGTFGKLAGGLAW